MIHESKNHLGLQMRNNKNSSNLQLNTSEVHKQESPKILIQPLKWLHDHPIILQQIDQVQQSLFGLIIKGAQSEEILMMNLMIQVQIILYQISIFLKIERYEEHLLDNKNFNLFLLSDLKHSKESKYIVCKEIIKQTNYLKKKTKQIF